MQSWKNQDLDAGSGMTKSCEMKGCSCWLSFIHDPKANSPTFDNVHTNEAKLPRCFFWSTCHFPCLSHFSLHVLTVVILSVLNVVWMIWHMFQCLWKCHFFVSHHKLKQVLFPHLIVTLQCPEKTVCSCQPCIFSCLVQQLPFSLAANHTVIDAGWWLLFRWVVCDNCGTCIRWSCGFFPLSSSSFLFTLWDACKMSLWFCCCILWRGDVPNCINIESDFNSVGSIQGVSSHLIFLHHMHLQHPVVPQNVLSEIHELDLGVPAESVVEFFRFSPKIQTQINERTSQLCESENQSFKMDAPTFHWISDHQLHSQVDWWIDSWIAKARRRQLVCRCSSQVCRNVQEFND